jgi:hypothetical protein
MGGLARVPGPFPKRISPLFRRLGQRDRYSVISRPAGSSEQPFPVLTTLFACRVWRVCVGAPDSTRAQLTYCCCNAFYPNFPFPLILLGYNKTSFSYFFLGIRRPLGIPAYIRSRSRSFPISADPGVCTPRKLLVPFPPSPPPVNHFGRP